MNVAFVNYFDFTSNSAIHIFNLANKLDALGHECAVLVPTNAESVGTLGEARFTPLTYADAADGIVFRDGRGPSLIHAWTPRENVRKQTESLLQKYGVPSIVHLEDNEDAITGTYLGIGPEEVATMPDRDLAGLPESLSHPQRSRAFLAASKGVTLVVERLAELAPKGVLHGVISPAYEDELFRAREPDPRLRAQLGIDDGDCVLVYPGNVHDSNADEVRSLYLAVALLNQRGLPVKLVRLGRTFVDFLGEELSGVGRFVVDVPLQPRRDVPRYFALADVFVQPGHPGPFNDYRLPSKLPEFLAMGRPVVLPATNLGLELRDGENAVLLREGHAIEIADAVQDLLQDAQRRDAIGRAGRRFAEERFSWARSALQLADFYDRVVADARPRPSIFVGRAEGEIPAIGYATVRDFADSLDRLPELARASGDMKDVQRPWALKTILQKVPAGGVLLEIGAGHPSVADLLARAGYGVWVVDPYDGRDGGPSDFEAVRAAFPGVHLVRGSFPDAVPRDVAGAFDCIYSISVLEHVPDEHVHDVCDGTRRYVRPGGLSIHAIDHVLRGNGAAEHLEHLHALARALRLDREELTAVLQRLEDDTETYFLSAEAHNRWRGSTDYADFPMRRCVSIQVCASPG